MRSLWFRSGLGVAVSVLRHHERGILRLIGGYDRLAKCFPLTFLPDHHGVRCGPAPTTHLQRTAQLPIHPLSRMVRGPLVHPTCGCVHCVSCFPSTGTPRAYKLCFTLHQTTKISFTKSQISQQLSTSRVCPRSLDFAATERSRH